MVVEELRRVNQRRFHYWKIIMNMTVDTKDREGYKRQTLIVE
jgi:hypothetical protein